MLRITDHLFFEMAGRAKASHIDVRQEKRQALGRIYWVFERGVLRRRT
jgi:hypothetical protein